MRFYNWMWYDMIYNNGLAKYVCTYINYLLVGFGIVRSVWLENWYSECFCFIYYFVKSFRRIKKYAHFQKEYCLRHNIHLFFRIERVEKNEKTIYSDKYLFLDTYFFFSRSDWILLNFWSKSFRCWRISFIKFGFV